MKGQDLMEQYPKATIVVKGFIIDKIKKGLKLTSGSDIDDIFLDGMIEHADSLLINMIENSPHSLFEVFDSSSIYISIIVRHIKDNEVLFNYRIVPRDKKNSSRSSKDRMTIESYAIEDAFEMLDNIL